MGQFGEIIGGSAFHTGAGERMISGFLYCQHHRSRATSQNLYIPNASRQAHDQGYERGRKRTIQRIQRRRFALAIRHHVSKCNDIRAPGNVLQDLDLPPYRS